MRLILREDLATLKFEVTDGPYVPPYAILS